MSAIVDLVEDTVGNVVDLVEDTVGNVVDLVEDTVGNVIDVITDVADWVFDEIIDPVVSTVGDIIQYALDNPIEALATLAVTIGAPYLAPFLGTTTAAVTAAAKWVIPLASGTQTLVNGGSLEDAIKSAAISFAGTYAAGAVSKAVSPTINQATQAALGSTRLSTTVASVLNTSTTAAAKTFVATGGDAKAALKSFTNAAVMGGVQGGLEAATDTIMGSIEQSFKDSDFGKSVNSLSKGVKESIYAGIAAELTGQDLSEQAIFAALDSDGFVSDIVGRYAPVAKFMDGLVTDAKEWLGKDLSETQIKILTDAVGASWSIAKAGNPDLAGEAFFGSMQKPAYEALIDTLSDPIDKALDSITGASKKAELAAAPLNEALLKTSEATAGYNALQKELADDLKTNEALKTTYNAAVNAYNQNKTEATKAALESAATALTNHSAAFNASYPATKAKMDAHEATYNKYFPTIDTLQAAYDKASTYVMQDIEDLDATLKPLLSGVDRVIATTLRPGIDEDSYRKANGLAADVDVYTHYLANQKEADYKISVDAVSKFNSMMKAGDIEGAMSLPNMPSADTRPNTYGPPSMPKIPGQDALPNVDLTVPYIAGAYRGDPRQYGLTPEAIAEYKADTSWSDAWYNFKSGGLEAVGLTVGGFGTALNEMSENIQNAFKLDASTANDLAGQNYAIYYDPNLTDDQKRVKIEALTEDYLAAVNRDLVENGVGDVTFFTEYTDPLKQYIMDSSKAAGNKISHEMQVRQYNALPAEDTTWEQILTGKAKDRLGRPYGLGDPLATMMSGVQELPDLLTDVALFALTKNPAIFAASSTIVTATSMLEAGEAAADEIKSNLNSAYTSGELQKTPEFVDLVRAYGGDEEAALAKLIDQGMDYAATSGVIGGFADVILAKVAAASGGAILLKNVPTGLQTVVKVGTGGVSEGITESFEQVPINLASINAGLDVAVNKDTGVAFLQALTSGGTATLGSASLDAVKHTLKAIKNGTYSIKLPDGTTVTPDKPTQGEITSATDTINNLDRIQAYSGLLNNLSSWGVIPSDPKLGTGAALVDTLKGLGITDTDTLTSIANISYSADYTTPEEISTALKFMSPDADATALPFSDKLVQDAIKEFSGATAEADLNRLLETYINPRYITREEVKKAAAEEGITLTDEQADEYVGEGDQDTVIDEVIEANDPLATTQEEARQFFNDLGFTPTDEQVAQFVGATSEEEQKAAIAEFVDPRYTDSDEAKALLTELGYNPTDEEVTKFVGQVEETQSKTAVGEYVDPRQVTEEEARQYFTDLGYTPTDEQVAQFVAQVEETTQQDVISKYVDPRQVTRAELEVIAAEEGLTLTDVLAAAYVGQGEAENFATETLDTARKEYDPLATTQSEAEAFFASTGYTATPAEIAAFVASKAEDVQTSAIGAYVDPRQITADEAKEFLSSIGYSPTEEEIAQFTGQLNDDTYQVTQKTAIDEYVDPRYVDAGEVRAAYEELGLVDVTQEDVDRFVGQYMEEDQLGAVREYIPTATFNVIKSLMGSPSIADNPDTDADESKDATGIYKLIEDSENAGATRDEALQGGIDALGDKLGLTRDELLAEIGLTKEELTTKIDTVSEDVAGVTEDVAGLTEDVAGLDTKIGDVETNLDTKIGDVETNLTDKITGVEETLGTDIQTVADFVGKPAREVTQADIDFVIDLIAQENVSAELIAQYDVTGDGIVDINDQTMLETALQGGDVTLAATSMFDPATGLYLQQEQDTQALLDEQARIAEELRIQQELDTQTVLDQNTELNTQLNTQINTNAQQKSLRDFLDAGQMGAFEGGGYSATTPDPVGEITPYDWQTIFRDQAQAGRYASPYASYGTTRANPTNPANLSTRPLPSAAGFAAGGQVEDINAMLLKLLGDT
jgi:hypothetical protein